MHTINMCVHLCGRTYIHGHKLLPQHVQRQLCHSLLPPIVQIFTVSLSSYLAQLEEVWYEGSACGV